MANKSNRNQIQTQKTDFNHHAICQLSNVFKCCKCKKNNSIVVSRDIPGQHCLFCGTPNYVKRENIK